MQFRKYNSIDNVTRTKTINFIIENGFHRGEWVSTLKVHGANYSYWCNGEIVKRAKRSGWLGDDEVFYGDNHFNYTKNVLEMFYWIKNNVDKTLTELKIFGEIYGGYYNHPDVEKVPDAVRVQKEVCYCPDNRFIVFDIYFNDICINWDKVKEYTEQFGFECVPELDRGDFETLRESTTIFSDPLYKRYGLPKIENNDAEGWVLKPVEAVFTKIGDRIILKGKNPKFAEKSSKKKKVKSPVKLSPEAEFLNNELSFYITENRLKNVLSHGDIKDITSKDFGKLLGLMSKDVFNDFMKDYKDDFEGLNEKEQKILKKNMNKEVANLIRPNFLNIIDGEF